MFLIETQPGLCSSIASVAEYQRKMFGVQAQQHNIGVGGASPDGHGIYYKRDTAQLCSSMFFCGWIITVCHRGLGFHIESGGWLSPNEGWRKTRLTRMAVHTGFLVPTAMFAYVAYANEKATSSDAFD